jgi:hypothetical protein
MSSLIVEVCKIDNIASHNNADRLELVFIKGWQCIVPKDKYKKGDKVVYVPIDSIIPFELSEKLGITKYLHNQKKDEKGNIISSRVRTVKLRGILSQGLIIDIEDPSWKIGDDVREKLGIEKYIPNITQDNNQNLIHKFPGWRLPDYSEFNKYTDIENYKNYLDVFDCDEEVIITEKIHGCAFFNDIIYLYNKKTQKIGHIVNKKLKTDVLGVDSTGNIVRSKILNWYNNGNTDEWKKVKFTRTGLLGNCYGSVIVTSNHEFFSPKLNKYVPCCDLKINDEILLYDIQSNLSFLQEQILLGIMIGDAYLGKDNSIIDPILKINNLLTKQQIVSISNFKPNYNISKGKYDLETETHNYFLNGVLVHNSNMRAAKLAIDPSCLPAPQRIINKLKKIGNTVSFGLYKYDPSIFLVGSHNCNIKNIKYREQNNKDQSIGIYWKIALEYGLDKKLKEGEEIFGEIYGKGIQKYLEYDGTEKIKIRFFDMKALDENGNMKYLDWDIFVKRCKELELPIVPILYRGPLIHNILPDLIKGNSTIGNHIREGCVIKPIKERFHPKLGRVILKCINDDYLLFKNKKEDELLKNGKDEEIDIFDH